MPTHEFTAEVSWHEGGGLPAAGIHRVTLPNRPPFEVSAAPQYRGDPSKPNPEELFLTSLASCQLLSFLALAGRGGLSVTAYDDHPTATLAIADRKMRVTQVVLRPRITLAPGGDAAKARTVVDQAHEACFIANSVACAVRVEPEIVVAT